MAETASAPPHHFHSQASQKPSMTVGINGSIRAVIQNPMATGNGRNPEMDILQAIEVELACQPDSFTGDDHQTGEKDNHPIAGIPATRYIPAIPSGLYNPTAVRDLLILQVIKREDTQPGIHDEGDK